MLQSLLREDGKEVSIRRICTTLSMNRSMLYYKPKKTQSPRPRDMELENQVYQLIQEYPDYGSRRITAVIRRRRKDNTNKKKVHRIIKLNNWQVIVFPS